MNKRTQAAKAIMVSDDTCHKWKNVFAILFLALIVFCCDRGSPPSDINQPIATESGIDSSLENSLTQISILESAFQNQTSNIQVQIRGTVVRFLSDDNVGNEHQRFIVKLQNNQTLLIAHNIDLSQRIPAESVNKIIYVFGEYEWNSEGGVIHWTHKDPAKKHVNGWIQYNGTKYD